MNVKQITSRVLGLALATVIAPGAFALGGNAGDTVSNTANVAYKIGTIVQPPVSSPPDTFKIDRRILLTVAEVGGAYTTVNPGDSNKALKFSVTNDTNATIDIGLGFAQSGAGNEPFGGTDNFNVAAFTIYQDDPLGASPGVWDAADTVVTYLDEMTEGESRTVFVVANIVNTRLNGDLATGILTGTAKEGGLAATAGIDVVKTPDATLDTQNTVDTVFGDAVKTAPVGADYSAARDGKDAAADGWSVASANIGVTKSSQVTTDPLNGATAPKRIPGATVMYCIAVENTGTVAADTVTITDSIPAGTTYVAGSIKSAVGGTGTACDATGTAEDDNTLDDIVGPGNDEADPAGGSFAAGVVTVNVEPSIAGSGGIARASFKVTID